MSYQVHVGHKAKKVLEHLDRNLAARIRDRLRQLALNPYDNRLSKQLEMAPERRSARVGDWRIVYQVHESEKILEVSSIKHRRRVYQDLLK